jgi:hypothetical protein
MLSPPPPPTADQSLPLAIRNRFAYHPNNVRPLTVLSDNSSMVQKDLFGRRRRPNPTQTSGPLPEALSQLPEALEPLPEGAKQPPEIIGPPPVRLPVTPGDGGKDRSQEPVYIGRRGTALGHVIRDTFYTLTWHR